MEEVSVKGLHHVEVRDDPDQAVLEIKYPKIRVLPPIGKQKKYSAPTLIYAGRLNIKVFHKILLYGCKVAESRLTSAQRLTNVIAVFCILSWRVSWMTTVNRSMPDAPPTLALTKVEVALFDQLVMDSGRRLTARNCG